MSQTIWATHISKCTNGPMHECISRTDTRTQQYLQVPHFVHINRTDPEPTSWTVAKAAPGRRRTSVMRSLWLSNNTLFLRRLGNIWWSGPRGLIVDCNPKPWNVLIHWLIAVLSSSFDWGLNAMVQGMRLGEEHFFLKQWNTGRAKILRQPAWLVIHMGNVMYIWLFHLW